MKGRDEVLDSIRGICALLVLAAHARAIVFVDLPDHSNPGIITKGFYFLTGIHFEAVVVFFVLSGYFVGGAVVAAIRNGTFLWNRYAGARMTRLWVVLVPALLLTFLCDRVGIWSSPETYAGECFGLWASGPSLEKPADFGIVSFLGSLLFLQTIETPFFGTNSPLWSLAYEFWYYVLFPVAAVGLSFLKQRVVSRALIYLLVLTVLIIWLPADILRNGWIWTMGVIVALIRSRALGSTFTRVPQWLVVALTAVPLGAGLVSSRLINHWITDFFVGGAFALWMVFLPTRVRALRWFEPAGRYLSAISYTLYLTHFPLLVLFAAWFMDGQQFHMGTEGFAVYAAFLLASIVVATVFWWLFEKRTDRIRELLMRRK